jgi:hypothetical protein
MRQCGCGDIVGQCACLLRENEALQARIRKLEEFKKDALKMIALAKIIRNEDEAEMVEDSSRELLQKHKELIEGLK